MIKSKIAQCCLALSDLKWKISFAESASAGRLSYEFSLDANSGKVLLGGLVSYDASLKEELLRIPKSLVERYTPESAEVTKAMALSFRKISHADVCVALTGLTSPGGSETPEKPVGTIFTCIAFPNDILEDRVVFDGSPEEIASKAVDRVADLLLQVLLDKSEQSNVK
ncbi:CinA family protein [Flavobacterium selenitireducens]|uniref:CinA family protein n=1 Tax=Flavobacterium selenitireducens TaxID=2722704 RepID=UPI00168A4105|nr:CinA family protein [Flavobacterium selenitireducens]MBD3582207.1 CinA family protein [Flavobacterium selenitireducens]